MDAFRFAADSFEEHSTNEIVDRYLAALANSIAAGDPLPMPDRRGDDDPEAWPELVAHARAWHRSQTITGGAQ